MSKEIKYPYATAYKIALEAVEQLKPHCERIEIAGSVRRKKAEVSDLDIVITSKPYSTGMFESGIASVVKKWEFSKGELEFGKTRYIQRILPEGVKLDLFFAEEENFGLIFAIRTGSLEYNRKVLIPGLDRQGFKSDGGYLFRNGEKYEVKEEKDLFRLIGIPYVEPEYRNL